MNRVEMVAVMVKRCWSAYARSTEYDHQNAADDCADYAYNGSVSEVFEEASRIFSAELADPGKYSKIKAALRRA